MKIRESQMGDLAIEIDQVAEYAGKNPRKIAVILHGKNKYHTTPVEVLEKFAKDWLSNDRSEMKEGEVPQGFTPDQWKAALKAGAKRNLKKKISKIFKDEDAMGGFGPQGKAPKKDIAVGGMMEGAYKPGERSTQVRCPRCKGKGTRALTATPEQSPCKMCKGTGKVFGGDAQVPFKVNELKERGMRAIEEFKQHLFDAAKWEGMTEEEEQDIRNHIWNMPPEKLISLGKNKTELHKRQGGNAALPEEAEQMYCPKCKINVVPEPTAASKGWKNACPQCGSKLDPKLKDSVESPEKSDHVDQKARTAAKNAQIGPDEMDAYIKAYKEGWQADAFFKSEESNPYPRGTHLRQGWAIGHHYHRQEPSPTAGLLKKIKSFDEDSTVAGIAGFNASMGSKKDSKPINFRENAVKPLSTLIKEIENPDENPGHGVVQWGKQGRDLTKLDSKALASYFAQVSQSGELQKQFGKDYSPEKFLSWVQNSVEDKGLHVSNDYLRKMKMNLEKIGNNPHKAMAYAYNAFLKGAGEGIPVDKRFTESTNKKKKKR